MYASVSSCLSYLSPSSILIYALHTPNRCRLGEYLARSELMIDTFKPESITPKTEGRLEMDKGKAYQLSFDTKVRPPPSHIVNPRLSEGKDKANNQKGSQVFDIRDEASAQRECVIVWDPMTVVSFIHLAVLGKADRIVIYDPSTPNYPEPHSKPKSIRSAARSCTGH
jgi:hypothetical protein